MTASGFHWLDYLRVAQLLLDERGEGFRRSATSRAYYAAFGHVRYILEQRLGRRFRPGGNVHAEVANALKDNEIDAVADLGRTLDRLRHVRNSADYDLDSFSFREAQLSLRWAEEITAGIGDMATS